MVKSKQNKIKLVQKFFSYNQNKVEIDCKQAFFSFVYFFPNSLFIVKQKRIVLFLWLKSKLLKSPTSLDFKSVFKKWKQARNRLCFLLFGFLLITRFKQNEATYPSENLWNFRFFIVFWPREEKTFWITAAHVQIKAYRKSKQRA